MSTLPVDAYRSQWRPTDVYLNTASYGLPPESSWDELQHALAGWRAGDTSWEPWGSATERARSEFAALVGVGPEEVATGSTVSGLLGPVAASLPEGSRVLVPDEEFTSNLWPYLVQEDRGVLVRTVPAARLADSIDGACDVVAFSAVQSATGEVADLDAIEASARRRGAITIVDATQACGWLPLDAARFDFVVCAAYKWLMSPRGSAFLTVRPERLDSVRPIAAGWYAGEDVHSSYYGMPLRLAKSTRRLDTSPAWFSWVGTQPAIELVNRIGVPAIQRHNVELANAFRSGLGLEPANSAIVSAEVSGAEAKLEGTGIQASTRAGKLRTAWHVYNTKDDVAAILQALL
ncbi:MAG: aminotransferase class V-fold PLP-dependent enzyme [Actinomycetota bacterium]|nr:aminotransferase class V-fold PLP-dependent enzyme [Actinomycetota bacterium]